MKEKKTIFIFGISSFVGSNLAEQLKDDYRIIGTYFNNPVYSDDILTLKCDVLDKEQVLNILNIFKPEYTIYSVGLTGFSDGLASPALCEAVNTSGVFNVTAGTERCRSKLIYLSSHFVYSGENVLFKDSDIPMPCTKYGNDLASSEFYIQRSCLNYIIFRCAPILGKAFNPMESKFLEILEINSKQSKEIPCDDEVQHGFLAVEYLAKVIKLSLDRHVTNQLLQIGTKDICSRFEFARKYLEAHGMNSNALERKKWIFPRTENKVALKDLEEKLFFHVDLQTAERELGLTMPTVDEVIRDLLHKRNKTNKKIGSDIEFI